MDFVKSLFSNKTAHGRVFRTLLQSFIGVLGAFLAVLAVPEIYQWFSSLSFVEQAGGVAVVVATVTTIHNYLEKLWAKLKE